MHASGGIDSTYKLVEVVPAKISEKFAVNIEKATNLSDLASKLQQHTLYETRTNKSKH